LGHRSVELGFVTSEDAHDLFLCCVSAIVSDGSAPVCVYMRNNSGRFDILLSPKGVVAQMKSHFTKAPRRHVSMVAGDCLSLGVSFFVVERDWWGFLDTKGHYNEVANLPVLELQEPVHPLTVRFSGDIKNVDSHFLLNCGYSLMQPGQDLRADIDYTKVVLVGSVTDVKYDSSIGYLFITSDCIIPYLNFYSVFANVEIFINRVISMLTTDKSSVEYHFNCNCWRENTLISNSVAKGAVNVICSNDPDRLCASGQIECLSLLRVSTIIQHLPSVMQFWYYFNTIVLLPSVALGHSSDNEDEDD